MPRISLLLLFVGLLITGCIGDDFLFDTVDPVLRIDNTVNTLEVNGSHQFESTYLNNVGAREAIEITWSSSNDSVIIISPDGLAQAIAPGQALITAQADLDTLLLEAVTEVTVRDTITDPDDPGQGGNSGDDPMEPEMRTGTIRTTTFYTLEGDFELIQENGGDLQLNIADNYEASSGLPGLYLYLTNNPNSTANAFEVGEVNVFTGAHSFTISGVDINEYSHLLYFCKPFSVKVGDATIE